MPETMQLDIPLLVGILLFGYLLGSIPFGLFITRMAGLGDVRSIGSGNIGATNVLRTGRKSLAAATLLGDALKGTLAVVIASRYGGSAALVAAFGALLGHCFPVWLRFRGGKGVATFFGVLLAIHWPTFLIAAVTWICTAFATRYSSLSALVASVAAPVVLLLFGQVTAALAFVFVGALLWARHARNLQRLVAGQESRIGR